MTEDFERPDEKVLYSGPGYEIVQLVVASSAVPYRAEPRGDGSQNHGFLDLRDRPDLVVEVPEAARSASLIRLLQVVNAPNSPFMSVGCECGFFANSQPDHKAAGYVGSYVGVAFRDSDRNSDPKQLVALARTILSGMAPSPYSFWFRLEVEPLNAFFGRMDCHELVIRCFGSGYDEPLAWKAFSASALAVADAFEQIIFGEDGTVV